MENNFQIEWVDLSKLKKDPENTNKHPKDQIDRLAKIIEYQGWRHPIIATSDNVIRAGEGRYLAAKKLKLKKVPVCYQDFKDDDQLRAFVTSDNAIAAWAELDLSMINEQIGDFDPSFDIDLLGLKDFTIDIAERLEPQTDEDEVPEPEESVCKPGDLWILGEHRLLCGDSTNIQHVEKLMNGEKADMVFTDPPYGIKYSGKGQSGATKANDFGQIKNDDSIDVAKDSFNLAKSLCDSLIFWGANFYSSVLDEQMSWIVWDKKTVGDNYSDCELAFTSKKGRIRKFEHQWHGMIKASEQGQKRVHPTQKPVALAEWCFENYGSPKKVLDLFGGSGSTLIACEKTNRKCYMMELDPHYCDVIINRWEQYTGKKAVLDGQEDQEKE